MDRDTDRGLVLMGAGKRVARPTAALPERKHPGAARTFGVRGFAPAEDGRQDEGVTGGLQGEDNRHAIEAAIEPHQVRAHPALAGAAQEALEHLNPCGALFHPGQRDRGAR
jgi:hypothetical protein